MGRAFAERGALTSTRFFPKGSVLTSKFLASVFLARGHPSVVIPGDPLVLPLRGALAPGGGTRAEEKAPRLLRLRPLMPPQAVLRFVLGMVRSSGRVSTDALTLRGTVSAQGATIARSNICPSTVFVPKWEIYVKRALLSLSPSQGRLLRPLRPLPRQYRDGYKRTLILCRLNRRHRPPWKQ